jgi:amicyanin
MAVMGAPSAGGTAPSSTSSPAPASPNAGDAVSIANFTFEPAVLTVSPGPTVTWTNHDDVPHTVTSVDKTTFASPGLDTDDTFSFRFTTPGTYAYFCTIHPMMTGKVVVA